jgi:hypothetical protein
MLRRLCASVGWSHIEIGFQVLSCRFCPIHRTSKQAFMGLRLPKHVVAWKANPGLARFLKHPGTRLLSHVELSHTFGAL